MKIQFKRILSLTIDGAVCSLLILQQTYRILLDCGINPNFDFTKYRQLSSQLKDVKLVLLSHSSLQYSGAYCFLVSQLGISPKIFYTTQPVMRYSPLNLHQQILRLRLPTYNKKTFNKIYSDYQEMNLIKPFQRQQLDLQGQQIQGEGIKPIQKKIYFVCYLAGGYLGSLYWRISFGLVNIVYMVEYNNYAMAHISGLQTNQLGQQPTHLMITDCYSMPLQPSFSQLLKNSILEFYRLNGMDCVRPKTINPQFDPKILIVCNPGEVVVQVLALLRKILGQIQQGHVVQKIGVIHLSSRFLQLIKSQSQYFSLEFKAILQKLSDYFQQSSGDRSLVQVEHSLILNNRLNVCSHHMLQPVLLEPANRNITVLRVGPSSPVAINAVQNLKNMKLFDEQELMRSASKMSISKIQSKMQLEQPIQEENSMEIQANIKEQNVKQQMDDSMEEIDLLANTQKKTFQSKYISSISGIPRFILSTVQKNEQITQYGLRHHNQNSKQLQTTIYDLPKHHSEMEQRNQNKKQSKIEVMNISFHLPSIENTGHMHIIHKEIQLCSQAVHRTQFYSSLRIIQKINPKDIILLNTPSNPAVFKKYQQELKNMLQTVDKKLTLLDSIVKPNCFFSYVNDMLQYRMNYLPEMGQRRSQRVRATIHKQGKALHIRLDCLQDPQISEFRMERFYTEMGRRMKSCQVLQGMIVIQGVKLYRRDKEIVLEGEYSEEYFKVRKALYQFLGLN